MIIGSFWQDFLLNWIFRYINPRMDIIPPQFNILGPPWKLWDFWYFLYFLRLRLEVKLIGKRQNKYVKKKYFFTYFFPIFQTFLFCPKKLKILLIFFTQFDKKKNLKMTKIKEFRIFSFLKIDWSKLFCFFFQFFANSIFGQKSRFLA